MFAMSLARRLLLAFALSLAVAAVAVWALSG